jgi:hypothetical protein
MLQSIYITNGSRVEESSNAYNCQDIAEGSKKYLQKELLNIYNAQTSWPVGKHRLIVSCIRLELKL